MPTLDLWLIAPGLALGAYATLIGAGGGFILVPVLLLLAPEADPETVTAISLAVVFVNALSGTIAYHRLGRIDFRAGRLFALFVVPGAVLGALATSLLPRDAFDVAFGVLLVGVSVFLFARPGGAEGLAEGAAPDPDAADRVVAGQSASYRYSYSPKLGCGLSFLEGFISSMLGIGGGIIQVPLLVRLLNFPPHVATATSQFIVAIMAAAATAVHLVRGHLASPEVLSEGIPLAIGVAVGAQIGARLSGKMHGSWLIRLLSLGLASVGLRLLIGRSNSG